MTTTAKLEFSRVNYSRKMVCWSADQAGKWFHGTQKQAAGYLQEIDRLAEINEGFCLVIRARVVARKAERRQSSSPRDNLIPLGLLRT